MDNSKPDFWKECPQILGNWHNILYILSGLPVYYIAEKAKSGYSVLIALFVVVVSYAVSYIVRYYLMNKNGKYSEIPDETKKYSGFIGDDVAPEAKYFRGYATPKVKSAATKKIDFFIL